MQDKIKVVKKSNGYKDLYINGVKVNNAKSYAITETEVCGRSVTSVSIELTFVDAEIVDETKELAVILNLDAKEIAELTKAMKENGRIKVLGN